MCVNQIVEFIKNFDNNIMTCNNDDFTIGNINEPERFGENIKNALFEIYGEAHILNSEIDTYYFNDDFITTISVKIKGRSYCCEITENKNMETFRWCVVPEDSCYVNNQCSANSFNNL
jgi:hypothetical protein